MSARVPLRPPASPSRFARDEDGGPTVEFIVVFVPLISLIIFAFQVSLSYFFTLSATEAANRGARLAATLPIAHCAALRNSAGERSYELDTSAYAVEPATRDLSSCLVSPSPCAPMTGAWTCTSGGAGVQCDAVAMSRIADEISGPGVTPESISVTYENSGLGYVGEKVIPLITVSVQARGSTLRSLLWADVNNVPTVSATAVGEAVGRNKWEDMSCG